MIEALISVGGSEAEFWRMTPAQYMRRMRGERKRLERDQAERTAQAWMTATLMRAKRIPKLEKLLEPDKPQRVGVEQGLQRIRQICKRNRKAQD